MIAAALAKKHATTMRRVDRAISVASRRLVAETEREEIRDELLVLVERRATDAPSTLRSLIANLVQIDVKGPNAMQVALVARLVAALAPSNVAPPRRPLPAGGACSIAFLVDVIGVGDPKGAKRWLARRGVPTIRAGRSIKVRLADLEKHAALEWRAARAAYERG